MLYLQLVHEVLDAVPLDFHGRLHSILAARGFDGGLHDDGPLAVIPSTALDGVLVWLVMVYESSTDSPDLLLYYDEVRDDLVFLLVDVSQSITLLRALELIRLSPMMLRGFFHVDHGGPLGWNGRGVQLDMIISYLRHKLRGVHVLGLRLGRVSMIPILLIPGALIAFLVLDIQSRFQGEVPVDQPFKRKYLVSLGQQGFSQVQSSHRLCLRLTMSFYVDGERFHLVRSHFRLSLGSELRLHLALPLIEIVLFQKLKPLIIHEILDPLRPCLLTFEGSGVGSKASAFTRIIEHWLGNTPIKSIRHLLRTL